MRPHNSISNQQVRLMLAFLEKTSFPAELIDEIFELVGDSTSTLLSLGLVCKRTLANTRSRLFSVLEFTNADSFNRFLRLAGAPWTSFTSSVREIHLQDLSHNCYWKYNEKDPRLLAASNLCNVKSLSITVHFSSRPLPDLVLEFIFHLKIRDLQLDGVAMSRDAGQIIFLVDGVPELKEESIALLTRLPPSVETLTFRNLRFDDIPKLSHRLPLFRRPIRFRMLDSISLALFKEAFNPLILSGLNIAVKTFHILSHDSITAAEARTRSVFTRRFLHHVGHSVEQLLVTLNARCRIINIKNIPPFLDPSQLSRCTNLRMIYFIFKHWIHGAELSSLVSVMWKMLNALPSPSTLEECWLRFEPSMLQAQLDSLGFLESPNVLQKFRLKFPKLKTIQVILGVHKIDLKWIDRCFEALRQLNGFTEMEENGILKIVTVNLMEHVSCHSKLLGCR